MLEIKQLTKTYKGGKKAVSDLSLTLEPGEIHGFIGHNGAGKTTTIKCFCGITDFDSGSIKILGHDITKEPVLCKQNMAYIPDNPDLYEHLTGMQYLNFVADIYQVNPEKRNDNISTFAKAFELTDSLGDVISSYSHGMKQKLAIISALIHEPTLLVLDEPFVGLDPVASLTLKNIMKQMCSEGKSVFFSTHVLEVAEKLCHKISIIKNGSLIISGKTEDITKNTSLEDVFMETIISEGSSI